MCYKYVIYLYRPIDDCNNLYIIKCHNCKKIHCLKKYKYYLKIKIIYA